MYFFYIDEAGSRDPEPKDGKHVYVLLAVGISEDKWKAFDKDISNLKLELTDYLRKSKAGDFNLADCEIKSNWLRNPENIRGKSPFLAALDGAARKRISELYFKQVTKSDAVIIACVIDKRSLSHGTEGGKMHAMAYEFILERIQHYMRDNQKGQKAIIVMDDSGKQLNKIITLNHATYQRRGNRNMEFPAIIEYPFFVRSELSNGVQLADLLAYTVYHAFLHNKPDYGWLGRIQHHFYKRYKRKIDGLKVWKNKSDLMDVKIQIEKNLWESTKKKR